MAGELKKYWPSISKKLIEAGIFEPVIMRREGGADLPCYHIHPIYTNVARGLLAEETWEQAKFAYVRHCVLWGHPGGVRGHPESKSMEWNDILQHEDHVNNVKAVASAWALDGGDIQEEMEKTGITLFDVVQMTTIRSLYIHERQPQHLLPLIRKQLLQLHMLADLIRPDGVPTHKDLHGILEKSWTLYRLTKYEGSKEALVRTTLDAVNKWRSANPGTPLTLPSEFTWFQFRHAEASLAINTDVYLSRNLFERNLADDPTCPYGTHFHNAIRGWQLQNLEKRAHCVIQIGQLQGTVDRKLLRERAHGLCIDFAPGKAFPFILSKWQEHSDILESLTMQELYSMILEREVSAVASFGSLTNRILDESMPVNFADMVPARNNKDKGDFFTRFLGKLSKDSAELKGVSPYALQQV
jgi:hypothetical protein